MTHSYKTTLLHDALIQDYCTTRLDRMCNMRGPSPQKSPIISGSFAKKETRVRVSLHHMCDMTHGSLVHVSLLHAYGCLFCEKRDAYEWVMLIACVSWLTHYFLTSYSTTFLPPTQQKRVLAPWKWAISCSKVVQSCMSEVRLRCEWHTCE